MNVGYYWPNSTCFTNSTFIIKHLCFYKRSYRVPLIPNEKIQESLTLRHSSNLQTGLGSLPEPTGISPGSQTLRQFEGQRLSHAKLPVQKVPVGSWANTQLIFDAGTNCGKEVTSCPHTSKDKRTRTLLLSALPFGSD